jgi:hypothetical protein
MSALPRRRQALAPQRPEAPLQPGWMLTLPVRQHGSDLGLVRLAGLNLEVVTFTLHVVPPQSEPTVLQRPAAAARAGGGGGKA